MSVLLPLLYPHYQRLNTASDDAHHICTLFTLSLTVKKLPSSIKLMPKKGEIIFRVTESSSPQYLVTLQA